MLPYRSALLAGMFLATSAAAPSLAADPTTMRIAGNFSQNVKHTVNIERPFFDALGKSTGLQLAANYNPMDVLGVQAADALRLLRSGAFDVMSVQIGMASRDDPFFEGVDLVGVATDMTQLRRVVDAYRDVFDKRLQEKFGAKVLTLWPFGPQVFYCNSPIKSLDDVKGLKVRSFTPSMAALIQHLGGTPVTLPFSEVYPALQRGVANCGVTSPTSGNSGKWPEVTNHFLPLSVSGSVQGHFANLAYWNRFSPEAQRKIAAEFKRMEDQMWDLAIQSNTDAANCNIGQDPCTEHTRFKMTPVTVSEADAAKIKSAVTAVVLPIWRESCNRIDPNCAKTWNETAGKAVGLTIQ
jgi:TRAP-type C4-dicarboxylate transport system substrate-binding protein